jgi:glycosyltransferase involved in cell wall biosynthesis
MKLSVIIPVLNEKNTILELLARVEKTTVELQEIIIVDDGSTDGTTDLLKNQVASPLHRVFFHEVNQGKGAAIRTGVQHATGDVVIIQDADLEYDPAEYAKLMEPIVDGRADVVFGSRFMGGAPHRVVFFWHMIGNRFLTLLSNMMTNMNLTDMETCYKMFKREIIQSFEIKENRFGFEPEITAKAAKTKCRIYEIGISYSGRSYEEGKKINWKDGFRAIFCILKYNLWGS